LRSEIRQRKTLENADKINLFKGFFFGGDGEIISPRFAWLYTSKT
jgi:hypothetical protein